MQDNIYKDDETVEDLQYNGLRIIQKKTGFRFGCDAVLLSGFVEIKNNHDIIDFGTGTGIIPILLAGYTKSGKITGIEIQSELADMAKRSVLMNGLEDRISIREADLKETSSIFGKAVFDTVVSNPPYMKCGTGAVSENESKLISRHEYKCVFDDIAREASLLLKPGGSLYLVHRPNRLTEIICKLKEYGLEPKKIRFVHPRAEKAPNLFLIKALKGGKEDLKILDPFYIYDKDGNFCGGFEDIRGH